MASSRRQNTSASTCSPETTHGTHLFKIKGYSLYRGLGVGNFIQSATFAVGGYNWCLYFYPDGNDEDCEDWASAYIGLRTEKAKVRALYDLSLVDQGTQPPPPPFAWTDPTKIDPTVFDSRGETQSWGFPEFVKKSELKKYILNDALAIECNITVIEFKEAQMQEAERKCEVEVPQSDLLDNLRNLLEAHEGADVYFNVRGEVFPAHKIVLAMRSPVFKAEFYGPMRRNNCTRDVSIDDMQPAVFKALLHFIYTDSLPPMDDLTDDEYEDMSKHLLVAADRYAMERMKLMCERKLSKILQAETVSTMLALADQHNCSQLKDACIEFINSSDRKGDVVASKGYEHLKRACPMIFADIWEKAAKIRKM